MRPRNLLLLIVAAVLVCCKKEGGPTNPPPDPTMPDLLLKEILIPNLPSPYYHFEYDAAGRPALVSFASGLTTYNVSYDGNRIGAMRNNTIVNKDRLQYFYDYAGRVFLIQYADSTGAVFTRSFFTYYGLQLVEVERSHKVTGGFIIDRTMTMQYNADGNLATLTDHRPPVDGQPESTFVDHFEEYDHQVSVDGFSLLHPDFFEHFFLLPGVQLRKNNPGKETRTGDGINYQIEYSYTYNEKNAPLTKKGEGLFTKGADAGKRFQTNANYTYY